MLSDEYDIIQFDLSGFGLSSANECNFSMIQLTLLENINYVMEQYANSSDFSIMTENEGIVPISKILINLIIQPKSLICFNAQNSMYDFMKNRYGKYLYPFYFSYQFDKEVSKHLNIYYQKFLPNTKFYFINNDEFEEDDYDLYFKLDFISIEKKGILEQ